MQINKYFYEQVWQIYRIKKNGEFVTIPFWDTCFFFAYAIELYRLVWLKIIFNGKLKLYTQTQHCPDVYETEKGELITCFFLPTQLSSIDLCDWK